MARPLPAATLCCLVLCLISTPVWSVPSKAPLSSAVGGVLPDVDPNLVVARAASADPLDLQATPQEDWAEDVTKGDNNPGGIPDTSGAAPGKQRGTLQVDLGSLGADTPVWVGAAGSAPTTSPSSDSSSSDSSSGGGQVTPPESNSPLNTIVGDSSSGSGAGGGGGVGVVETSRVMAGPSDQVAKPQYKLPRHEMAADINPVHTKPDDAAGAAAIAAEQQEAAAAAAAAKAAKAAAESEQEGAGSSRRLLAVNATSGNSNAPGAFTGGPTLTKQHSGWSLSDSPDKVTSSGGSVTSSGSNATLDPNILRSINQDLRLFLTYGSRGGRRRAQLRRQLLATRQAEAGGPKRRLQQDDDAWPTAAAVEAAGGGSEEGGDEEGAVVTVVEEPTWGDPDIASHDPSVDYQPQELQDFQLEHTAAVAAAAAQAHLAARLNAARTALVGVDRQDTPADLATSEESREDPSLLQAAAAAVAPEAAAPESAAVGKRWVAGVTDSLGQVDPASVNSYELEPSTPDAPAADSTDSTEDNTASDTNTYEVNAGDDLLGSLGRMEEPTKEEAQASPEPSDTGATGAVQKPKPRASNGTPAGWKAAPTSSQPEPQAVPRNTRVDSEPAQKQSLPTPVPSAAAVPKDCSNPAACDVNPATATGSVLGGEHSTARSTTPDHQQVLQDDSSLLGPAPPSHRRSRKLMGNAGQTLTKGNSAGLTLPKGNAGKPLYGVTYSWRRAEDCDGVKRVCRCPHPDDLEQDLDLLHRYSSRVRTFSAECPELLSMLGHYLAATAAPSTGAAWHLGVWLGPNPAANQAQLKRLGDLLEGSPRPGLVYAISVGSEVLARRDLTETQLLGYIAEVRGLLSRVAVTTGVASLATIPLTTTEPAWALTPRVAAALDLISLAVQPFYEGAVDTTTSGWEQRAVLGVLHAVRRTRERYAPKPVVVAELGWPTASGASDTNMGTSATARAFAREWTKAADKAGIAYFYHELTDAAWKTVLREPSTASAATRSRGQPTDLKPQDVLADEHFGLVSGDRLLDKELLSASGSMGSAVEPHAKGERGVPVNDRAPAGDHHHDHGAEEGSSSSSGSASTISPASKKQPPKGSPKDAREQADEQVATSRRHKKQ